MRDKIRPTRGFPGPSRKSSPSNGPPSSPSAKRLAQRTLKRRNWAVFSPLGEFFRARMHTRTSRATNVAHETRQHGDVETTNTTAHSQQGTTETRITSARANCTKNAHFSPAKAMAVSTGPPHRPAKATPVSRPTHERNRWHHHKALDSRHRDLSTGVMLNARYPQGNNFSFSFRSHRAIIHQSGPYPQLQMVVSNCYLNSSHPSDRRFAL